MKCYTSVKVLNRQVVFFFPFICFFLKFCANIPCNSCHQGKVIPGHATYGGVLGLITESEFSSVMVEDRQSRGNFTNISVNYDLRIF